jgi:hypothetical protein
MCFEAPRENLIAEGSIWTVLFEVEVNACTHRCHEQFTVTEKAFHPRT